MPLSLPVGPSDYYEFFPTVGHRAGDIWTELPTFGLLGVERAAGVVITPACDLQNGKAETITYLPILSIRRAFLTRGFVPEIVRAIDGQLQVLGHVGFANATDKFIAISSATLDEISEIVAQRRKKGGLGSKETSAAIRVDAGVALLREAIGPDIGIASREELSKLFGAPLDRLVERIVTNSHRADIHFLPTDEERLDWSVMSEPSVCLFRYPLSAPIEIFDAAQDITKKDWQAEVKSISRYTRGASSFASARPMKRQTLKPRFFADLITRYLAMHIRLGAPDFSDESVNRYVAEVLKGRA